MKPLFEPQRYIRVYFDLGVEFGFTSDENKLLEIANCVYHGFNLYESLKEHCEEHPERKSRFCLTLTKYIELIRGEKNGVITTLYSYDQFTFKQLVDLLEEEIMRLYRFPRIGEPYFVPVKDYYDGVIKHFKGKDISDLKKALGNPTPFEKIPITEKELRKINPWDGSIQFVKPIESPSTLYDKEAKCVLKCDEPYIKEFNKLYKGEPYEYRIQKWPKPFIGNPLTSKVVLLSLNPGFNDRTNRMLANAMNIHYREAINKQLIDQMSFNTPSFFCSNIKGGGLELSYLEAQAFVDNWYWYDIIEDLRDHADLPKTNLYHDPLYEKLSVIQYVGYASTEYKSAPNGRIFPSQHFTKLLIQHLAFNSDKVFVVARSENKWHKFIGDEIWNKLEQENRLILGRKIRMQSLTEVGLGKDGFDRLVDILK